jgi:drug efflux transport system permease protein
VHLLTEGRTHDQRVHFSLTRLRAVARKEILQLRRDPRSLAMGFLMPALLLVLFGYAITWDVDHVKMAVVDHDASSSSRTLIEAFESSGYFDVVARPPTSDAIDPLLDRGTVQIALIIPPDFESDLGAGRPAQVQAIVDGSDANTATIVLSYAQAITRSYAAGLQLASERRPTLVTTESRVWYNEDLTSRNMIVPGLVAVIMAIIAAMLTSLTIAREWERGTMEQLAATPVSRVEVVIGKLLPYLGIGLVDVVIASILGVLLYGVPFRGDPWLLMGLSVLFLCGALGLGIFVSAVARSQLLATQMALLTTFLPSYLISGFMFDISVMPWPLRVVSHLVPARYFLVVTRGIFLKGVGVQVLYVQALLMVLFAIIGLGLAIRVFRKELR